MSDRVIKCHDDAVMARAKFLDESGQPIDLTGCTVVYILVDTATQLALVTRDTAVVRDQTLYPGEVYYLFQAGGFVAPAYGEEEWEVTYPGGRKESFPLDPQHQYVRIQQDLDNT